MTSIEFPDTGSYIILIDQLVVGKSRAPAGFSRIKPFRYTNSHVKHPILYTKLACGDICDVMAERDAASEAMQKIRDNQDGKNYNIVDYRVSLYSIDLDRSVVGSGVLFHNTSSWKITMSNVRLTSIGVIPRQTSWEKGAKRRERK